MPVRTDGATWGQFDIITMYESYLQPQITFTSNDTANIISLKTVI